MPRVYTDDQKQRIKEYGEEWRLKNKEKQIIYYKEYYEKNKEKYKERNKEKKNEETKKYRQTPNGKKKRKIYRWKSNGLVSTDYNLLYENYLKSINCEECGVEYGKYGDGTGTYKCMDHNHETGLFRNYLCNTCNIRRR